MQILDLIPAGCSVETSGTVATVHDANGDVIAILCADKNNLELARLIAGLPTLFGTIEDAIDRGLLLPVLYGMRRLDSAVFDTELQPAA